MSEARKLRVFVSANADLVDAVVSSAHGGAKLGRGVSELIAASHPDIAVEVTTEPSSGFATLRNRLETGTAPMLAARPDIVMLSIADDVAGLGARPGNTEDAVHAVGDDLVAVVRLIKDKLGAHIFVAAVSTVDPADTTSTYHGLVEEPFSLRAHRLDLMLVGVSHDEGISIIDVDRVIAEIGAGVGVTAAMDYSPVGCAAIAGEIVRIIDDYGFLDGRSLLAQVGARGVDS